MHSEVINVQVIMCATSAAVFLISLWIVIYIRKMRSNQVTGINIGAGDNEEENIEFLRYSFKSVAAEIYDAAKKSGCQESLEKCSYLLRLHPQHVNTPVSKKNFTPFLRACWTGNTSLVKFMLENGADVSRRTSDRESAFFLAVHKAAREKSKWDPSLLLLLYKSGCCINARKHHGYSPLHLAVKYGHAQLVGWLLSHGADPLATTDCGITPANLAWQYGHTEVVDMLTVRVSESSNESSPTTEPTT